VRERPEKMQTLQAARQFAAAIRARKTRGDHWKISSTGRRKPRRRARNSI